MHGYDVAELLEEIASLKRERDEYRARVHELTELRGNMTSAATMAAATAEQAIRRAMTAEKVANSARAFVRDPKSVNALFALDEAVTEWEGAQPS